MAVRRRNKNKEKKKREKERIYENDSPSVFNSPDPFLRIPSSPSINNIVELDVRSNSDDSDTSSLPSPRISNGIPLF